MEIEFVDESMRDLILEERKLVQKYGPQVAKQVRERVAEILACLHLLMLKELPNGLHPLRHKRKGQFAVDLGPAYRLVFEPAHEHLPKHPDGTLIWERITTVRLLGIIDYHDE